MQTMFLDFIQDHINDDERPSPSNTGTEHQTHTHLVFGFCLNRPLSGSYYELVYSRLDTDAVIKF